MEEYWFQTKSDGVHQDCIEPCHVKDNGIMIGSAKCQQCEFCMGAGGRTMEYDGPDWIKCSRLSEARWGVLEKDKN